MNSYSQRFRKAYSLSVNRRTPLSRSPLNVIEITVLLKPLSPDFRPTGCTAEALGPREADFRGKASALPGN